MPVNAGTPDAAEAAPAVVQPAESAGGATPTAAADAPAAAAAAAAPSSTEATAAGADSGAAAEPAAPVPKQWGPVVKGPGGRGGGGTNGRGPNNGKWSGVDPVMFITDEALLSSVTQFYGIVGASAATVRAQLVRASTVGWTQTPTYTLDYRTLYEQLTLLLGETL